VSIDLFAAIPAVLSRAVEAILANRTTKSQSRTARS